MIRQKLYEVREHASRSLTVSSSSHKKQPLLAATTHQEYAGVLPASQAFHKVRAITVPMIPSVHQYLALCCGYYIHP